jgi:hypothetical protein
MKNLKLLPVLCMLVFLLASCSKEKYNFTKSDFTWDIKEVSTDCDSHGVLYIEAECDPSAALERNYESQFTYTYQSDCSGTIRSITDRSDWIPINDMIGEPIKVLTLSTKPLDTTGQLAHDLEIDTREVD